MRNSYQRSNFIVFSLLSLAGCGGGGGGGSPTPTPPSPAPTVAAPTVSLSPSAPSITYGSDLTLTWSSTNSTGCTASGAWTGAKAAAGTETIRPTDASSNFLLNCSGTGGSGQASTTVSVQAQQATQTPTSTNPVVTMGELSVNLTGQTSVQNTQVTMAKFSDPKINAKAGEDEGILDTDLSLSDTYRIMLSAAPIALVPVTLQTGTRYANTDKFPVIYYQSEPSEDGDGQFAPLSSQMSDANALSASVPPEAFIPNAAGQFEAILKVGLATGYDTAVVPQGTSRDFIRKQQRRVTATAVTEATVPCPIDVCTETSQFNPKRKLPGKTARAHNGTDFSASTAKPVSGIAGSIVVKGVNDITNGCGRNITLRAPSPRVAIRYCHLSVIDPDLLNAAGTVVIDKALPADNLLGTSGDTGGASGHDYAYHLHVEISGPSKTTCKKNGVCKYVFEKPESIFPFMVDTFEIKDIADRTMKKDGVYNIDIEATSIGGIAFKSAVGNSPKTANGDDAIPGDPTRKICLTSNNQVSITYSVEAPAKLSSGPTMDGDIAKCAPWGTPIKITASSDSPTTTVKARYTTLANASLPTNKLSEHVAEITLDGKGGTPTVEEFIDWSINGVSVARVKPDEMTLRGDASDGNGGKRYLDLSAFKNPATATDTQPQDIALLVENVSIAGTTQITDSSADCLNPDLDRDFRHGSIRLPNPIAEQLVPGAIYIMMTCDYVTRYSMPAGSVTINTKTSLLADDPTTPFSTENALQIAYGTFDFNVTDQEVARIGGFALGDKRVTGSFQFKLGVCSVQNGCPLR